MMLKPDFYLFTILLATYVYTHTHTHTHTHIYIRVYIYSGTTLFWTHWHQANVVLYLEVRVIYMKICSMELMLFYYHHVLPLSIIRGLLYR